MLEVRALFYSLGEVLLSVARRELKVGGYF